MPLHPQTETTLERLAADEARDPLEEARARDKYSFLNQADSWWAEPSTPLSISRSQGGSARPSGGRDDIGGQSTSAPRVRRGEGVFLFFESDASVSVNTTAPDLWRDDRADSGASSKRWRA